MTRALLRDSFMHTTSETEKQQICRALEQAIDHFIFCDRPVYLLEFGILTPRVARCNQNFIHQGQGIVRSVAIRQIEFHKCGELTAFHRDKHKNIVEERALVESVLAKLPIELQASYGFTELRNLLRGLIESVKHETITRGQCTRLDGLGTFFALHNRQGATFNDWYAGANIIFKLSSEKVLACEECRSYERPVLQDSWEMLSVIFGQPIHVFSLNIADELKKLGYSLENDAAPSDLPKKIKVGVFANKVAGQQQLIYCTDGLRSLGLNSSNKSSSYGVELVFQVAYDTDFRDSAKNSSQRHDDILLPDWPRGVLTMGWVLMQSSKTKTVRLGAGMSFNMKLCPDLAQCRLTALLVTSFSRSRAELLSPEGPFYYVNLVGITEDEARLAEGYSARNLNVLLEHKNLDQITKICRPSLLARSAFLDLEPKPLAKEEKKAPGDKSAPEIFTQQVVGI